MKDYNSIPFKNKAIDRLTRNTTVVPGTQDNPTMIKEVTINPSNLNYEMQKNPRGVVNSLSLTKVNKKDQYNGNLMGVKPKVEKKPKHKLDQGLKEVLGTMGGLAGFAMYANLKDIKSKSERKIYRDSWENREK